MDDALFGQLAAAGFVLLLLAGTIAVLRRRGLIQAFGLRPRVEAPQLIRLLGRQTLTPHHTLFAVEVDGARFLLATHPSGSQLQRLSPDFAETLGRSLAHHNHAGGNHE
jgi:flagellar biogenesis protein FliO